MALSTFVSSKNDLVDYVKKRCGYPVVNVEVTDDQIEIAIQEALERYITFAEGGIQMRFKELDIVEDQHEYDLGFDVSAILQVYDYDTSIAEYEAPFPDKVVPDMLASSSTGGSLLTLELTRQQVSTVDFMLRRKTIWDFNPTTNVLYLPEVPSSSKVGLIYYQKTDYSDENSNIYDHNWIKNYSYAMTMIQWGVNLQKFEGSLLPSGLTVNAALYTEKGGSLQEKLDTELEEVWALPANFSVG